MRWLALTSLFATACLEAIAPEVGPPEASASCNDDSDPGADVSFTNDIVPLLRAGCYRCHLRGGDGQKVSGFEVTTYDTLRAGGVRSRAAIVIDRTPCDSVLWQKLGPAPPFGARMPKERMPLTDEDRQLIHDWIAEGAEND